MPNGTDDLTAALQKAHAAKDTATAFASQVTPAQVANITTLYSTYPSIGPSVIPLGLAGVTADSPVAERAAQAKTLADSRKVRQGTPVSGGWLGRSVNWLGDNIVKKPLHAVEDVAKPIVKYGSAGAAFPLEYVQAATRQGLAGAASGDWRQAAAPFGVAGLLASGTAENNLGQTTVGAGVELAHDQGKLGSMLLGHGDEQLSGDGWFISPSSPTGKQQARNARAIGLVNGHAITPGRVIASAIGIEPGSAAYNVVSGLTDLSASLVEDPLTFLGGAAGEANRTKNLLHGGVVARDAHADQLTGVSKLVREASDTGLIEGSPRTTVLPEKAWAWLDGAKGQQVVQHITDISPSDPEAFNKIWRGTGKKLPVDLVAELVDSTDGAKTRDLLAEAIGVGAVREKMLFKAVKPPPRIAGMMPGAKIDTQNIDDAVEQLDRYQRNIRMPEAQISANNLMFARAGSAGERLQIVSAIQDTLKQSFVHAGFSEQKAHNLTRLWSDSYEDMRKYYVDQIGDNADIPGAVVAGKSKALAKAHLSVELLDRYIPLPNARDLKNATRTYKLARQIESHGLYKAGRDTADFLTNDIFKTFALALRPAWTVRVVGEEQFRMGAAGLASAVHHPLSYIAWVAGDHPTKLKTIYDNLGPGGIDQLVREGHSPKEIARIAAANAKTVKVPTALGKVTGGGRGTADVLGGVWGDDVPDGLTEFQQALNHGSAGWRNRDWIMTRHWGVYGRNDEPYVKSWLDELTQLASAPEARETARDATAAKEKFWSGKLAGLRHDMHQADPAKGLDTRQGSDAFIDTVLDRIRIKTAGDPELMKAVQSGRVQGHALMVGTDPNPRAIAVLEHKLESGVGPERVKGQIVATDASGTAKFGHLYDQTAEFMFNALGSVPTNKLSRSPAFRQFYWKRIEELSGMVSAQDKARLVRGAMDAGMPKSLVARLKATESMAAGNLSLVEADKVAKSHALLETRDLLYSLHEKSQAADAFRIVFPFAEAWREVLTRWAKLANPVTGNPSVMYRASQVGMGEGSFYHPDPITGQEMISVPGSDWLTKKFTGVPVKMDMPLSGLNMFGQVLPGVGPVVSIPASKLIPDRPEWDGLKSQILPYGDTDTSSGILESFFPSYLKKVLATTGYSPLGVGATQKRQIASTTRDVMAYLYSTGDYDISTPEGQDKLVQDAKSKATRVYLIRGLAQSSLPSSPTQEFFGEDKQHHLRTLYAMAQDYRSMQQKDYTTATERFLNKYGDFAFLSTVGKTTGSTQPTDTVNNLAREHPEIARQFPTVFGFFAPGGQVDPGEIERQISNGTRALVAPDTAVKVVNIRLANAVYANAKTEVGDKPTTDQRAWLRDIKDALVKKYPGYTGQPPDLSANPAAIADLTRAVKNPALAGTDAGQGLALYLGYREQALASAQAGGLAGFQTAKAAQPLRDWLSQVGQKVIAAHPGFGDMWDQVFAQEVGQ